jgi:DNA-binding NtrC family response regulator
MMHAFEDTRIRSPQSAARRVLIVEDDHRLREMLVKSTADMGLFPTAASSAEVALRLARSAEPFAIAVVDLNLPGMNGLDLCEQLRRHGPPAELVILTGFGDLEAARRAIRLEVVDFLTKPCRMDELERALMQARLRWLDRWFHAAGPSHEAASATPAAASLPPTPSPQPDEKPNIDDAERRLILDALAQHHGNRELAAAQVGISVRKLYYRLKQYQRVHGSDETDRGS